jgi:4-hydroxy-2-oxoheptanedioate aldolase
MRENSIKNLLAEGNKAVNGWCSTPSPFSAEVLAHAGFDSVTIDLQHGLIDYQMALSMMQAINTTETPVMCRVPWLENGIIMKMLDAGVAGVICPMVNNAADAENFVAACSYPPRGRRSFGPTRAVMHWGGDYAKKANDQMLKIAMIETVEALENMDAIMSTPGLNGIYIGPSDLSFSMGHEARLDPVEPAVVEAVATIRDNAHKHGLFCGLHCSDPAYAKDMHEKGMNLVSIPSDNRLLMGACKDWIAGARGSNAKEEAPKSY